MRKIRLLTHWNGLAADSILEVGDGVAELLVARAKAVYEDEPKPKAKAVEKPPATKAVKEPAKKK